MNGTADDLVIRTARKQHTCARQAYFDRLSDEAREWYKATPCPLGGVIKAGEKYVEQEGIDPFHPSRSHIGCEA